MTYYTVQVKDINTGTIERELTVEVASRANTHELEAQAIADAIAQAIMLNDTIQASKFSTRLKAVYDLKANKQGVKGLGFDMKAKRFLCYPAKPITTVYPNVYHVLFQAVLQAENAPLPIAVFPYNIQAIYKQMVDEKLVNIDTSGNLSTGTCNGDFIKQYIAFTTKA